MTDTTPDETSAGRDLTIPQAAADEWFACGCSESGCIRAGYQADALPIVVAAELRRFAAYFAPSTCATALRARAEELDPEN